jgi:hypothetical protein
MATKGEGTFLRNAVNFTAPGDTKISSNLGCISAKVEMTWRHIV